MICAGGNVLILVCKQIFTARCADFLVHFVLMQATLVFLVVFTYVHPPLQPAFKSSEVQWRVSSCFHFVNIMSFVNCLDDSCKSNPNMVVTFDRTAPLAKRQLCIKAFPERHNAPSSSLAQAARWINIGPTLPCDLVQPPPSSLIPTGPCHFRKGPLTFLYQGFFSILM